MIIECDECKAVVDAKVISKKEIGPTDNFDPIEYSFLQCPVCESIMLGLRDLEPDYDGNWIWGRARRIFPEPFGTLDYNIPKLVRHSLEEAKLCLKVGAYSASAVMCGRSLEAVCKLRVNVKTLAKGLIKLKEQKIIDDRLFKWSEALRKERNLGAHATSHKISAEDARDVFDFAKAICDYIYVLSDKFEKYVERKIIKK